MEEQQTTIFALDIGTRSVIGVILQPIEDGSFTIKDIKIVEHKERSMLDGQIHDVLAVADTIKLVKHQLEAINGPLKKVSVAAAGRSLRTNRVKIDINIEGQPFLRKEDIRALELSAVQEAQKQLIDDSQKENLTHYHCVGYSVVNYYLDDQIIGNLIDQRGKKATVEIIATFLPRVVVDSLISSLNRADLEMDALTLEPIAAIHVLIPPSMRKLNIAFVDIGAGTSDIAITDEGTIVAYGMVPVAGDEITEAISKLYLLDFPIAEEIKRKCSIENELTFTDILGMTYTLPSEVVIQQINNDIEKLASNIANRILELNGKFPQAVMLVGGGSQTPKLTEKLANILNLPTQRVAVRGADAIQYRVQWPDNILKGPELVTPVGIGISSQENPIKYLTFRVNGETIRLFEMKTITVGDALIAGGIPIKKLFGKPGMAMTVAINDKIKMIPGEHGTLPQITVNNKPATIDTNINNNDIINVEAGKNGKDASLTVEEAIKYSSIKIYNIVINNKPVELKPLAEVNGVDADYKTRVNDRDSIKFYQLKTIEEALVYSGYSTIPYTEKVINFEFMGEKKSFSYTPKQIYRNHELASLKDKINDGDNIVLAEKEKPYPNIGDLLKNVQPNWYIKVSFNGQPIKIEPATFQVLMNKQRVATDTPLEANSSIEVIWGEDITLTFSDVFRYVDIERTKPEGKSKYIIKINGEQAEFYTPINNGDQLELYWV